MGKIAVVKFIPESYKGKLQGAEHRAERRVNKICKFA
jgi:hypothetical protein